MEAAVVIRVDAVVVCSVDVISVVVNDIQKLQFVISVVVVVDHAVVVVVSMVDVFIVVDKSTVGSVVEIDSDDSSVNVLVPIVVVPIVVGIDVVRRNPKPVVCGNSKVVDADFVSSVDKSIVVPL